MKEALRYLNNAKRILKRTSIEGKFYADKKPVREAFGTAYLAILKAITNFLLKKDLRKRSCPNQSMDTEIF